MNNLKTYLTFIWLNSFVKISHKMTALRVKRKSIGGQFHKILTKGIAKDYSLDELATYYQGLYGIQLGKESKFLN